MNTQKLILKEGLLNLIALFIALCLNFLSTLLITKAFPVNDVGLYNAIVNTTVIISTITLVGINNIFIKAVPGFKENKEQEASDLFIYQLLKNLAVTVLCIILIYVFKRFVVNYFIKNELAEGIFYILPLYIVNTDLQQVLSSYLRSWYKTSLQSFIVNTLLKSINFLAVFACLIFRLSINQYIHYYLYLLVGVNLLLLAAIVKNGYIKDLNFKRIIAKYLNKNSFIDLDLYGLVMSASAIASVLGTYSDRFLVNLYSSNYQLAIYNTAFLIGSTIAIFGNSLALIAHPLMGKFIKENNIEELDKVYKITQKWSLIATIPVATVFVVYSKELLSLLGTAGGSSSAYVSGASVLAIIVIGQLINVGTGMCGGIISYSKYYRMDLYTQIILAILSIGFNLAFIPMYGMNGAAVAASASLAVYNIIKVIYVKIKFGILPFDRSIIKILTITILAAGATALANRIINLGGFYIVLELGLATLFNYIAVFLSGLSKYDLAKLKEYLAERGVKPVK